MQRSFHDFEKKEDNLASKKIHFRWDLKCLWSELELFNEQSFFLSFPLLLYAFEFFSSSDQEFPSAQQQQS